MSGVVRHVGSRHPRPAPVALCCLTVAVLVAACSSGPAAHESSKRTTTTTTHPSPPRTTTTTSRPAPTTTTTAAPTTTTTAAPAFTSAGSATAVVGTNFSFVVTTTCPTIPSIRAGGLPSGLKMVDHANCSATIAGVPQRVAAGVRAALLTADFPGLATQTQRLVITVNMAPTVHWRSTLVVTAGIPFSDVVAVGSGLPVPSISSTSPLPGGVTLVAPNGTATLTGPAGPGTGGVYQVTLSATNGIGPPVAHALALTVNQVPAFTSAPAVAGKAGAPLAPVTVKASGYPTAVITATGLPSGLKLTGMGGGTAVISGTPAASESGPYTVSLRAHNRVGVVTQQLIVTILP